MIVDTSVLYAVVDRDDVHHTPSRKIIRSIDGGSVTAIVTDFVIAETLNLIHLKIGHAAATDLLDRVSANGHIETVHTTQECYHRSLEIFRTNEDLSFVDASLVAHAKESDVGTILSFDSGFDSVSGITRADSV